MRLRSPCSRGALSRPNPEAALFAVAFAALCGCGGPDGSGTPGGSAIVVGIQSEPLTGAVGKLHVVTSVGAETSSDNVLSLNDLPHEVRVTPPPGELAAALAVRVDGYADPGWTPRAGGMPVLVRTARAHFVPGRTALLRIVLQGQCRTALPGGPPGGPTCSAPLTCIGGVCVDDTVPAQSLETYSADWPMTAPDVCKPANAGPPVVQVGTGQSDYLPVTAGQLVKMEQGPQGGHHIWIAVRQKNLKQSGSTTTLTGVVPTVHVTAPQTSFAFTFNPDEGGFCKVVGLRYQLDVDGADYRAFLGKPIDVTVTVRDATGATGVGVAHLTIDANLLCPSGTLGCP